MRPAWGSIEVLKTKAAAGASVDEGRSAFVGAAPCFEVGTVPWKAGCAVGDGTSSTIASSSATMPLGLVPDAK